MIDITYTQAFQDYMTSYSAEVHSAGGAYTSYSSDETRPVYIKAGQAEVSVDFVKPNGKGAKVEVANFKAEPRHFYHLTVDMSQGSGVIESLIVTIDETVEEETVEIDISDEVLNTSAPEVTAEGFVSGEQFSFFPETIRVRIRYSTSSPAEVSRNWYSQPHQHHCEPKDGLPRLTS